jgi:hypothetical protein
VACRKRLTEFHQERMTPDFLHQFAGQVGTTIMYGVAIIAAAILATVFLAESNSGVRPPGVRKIPGARGER